jgi:hypothetical protein
MNVLAVEAKSNFFHRCWAGSARLWQAYWLVGLLGQFAVVMLFVAITYPFWRGPQDSWWADGLVAFLIFAYELFASVSIWRCSKNVSISVLGKLARIAVVVFWVSLAGIITWAAL